MLSFPCDSPFVNHSPPTLRHGCAAHAVRDFRDWTMKKQFRNAVAGVVAMVAAVSSVATAEAETLAKNLFGGKSLPAATAPKVLWLLLQGLLLGRRGDRHRRAELAGDAAVAEPALGPPDDDQPDRETVARGIGRWLAGPAAGRHLAAARRADADRACVAPDRPRRRHLVHADARSETVVVRAREHERDVDGQREDAPRHRPAVDAGA